jgi:hypothetical protein
VYAYRKLRLVNDRPSMGLVFASGAHERLRIGESGAKYITPAC